MARPLVVMFILALFAFSTRALPLAISSYPFNNDGMTEARIADDILESGNLDPPANAFYANTHSVITPAHDALLAFVAAAVGGSPYDVAQLVVATLSIITIVGIYLVALKITRSHKGALSAAMVLGLSGTFVFLSGSAWKASLGVALLVMLMYAHMHRTDRRMLVLEISLLATMAIVHHLVAILAYLAIAYSTGVSVINALMSKQMTKYHRTDILVIFCISAFAFLYYSMTSLDSLVELVAGVGIFLMAGVFVVILAVTVAAVRAQSHTKYSFAPIPATAIMALFVWDYFRPMFPYSAGFPAYILLIGLLASVLIGIGWYGFETIMVSKSKYRFLPLMWALPVVTLLLQAIVGGATLDTHQVIYRSFDFGYLAIALGIAVAVASLVTRPKAELAAAGCILCVLCASFPYGYMTNALEGIRHDTQEYEVDALDWVYVHEGSNATIQSDERLSYDGRALYDYVKRPYVPTYIIEGRLPSPGSLNLFLEEWTVIGVNDYPNGHPVLNESDAMDALSVSNVLYVGGPSENNIVIFRSSPLGQALLLPPL